MNDPHKGGCHVIRQRSGHVNPIVGVGDGAQLNTDEEPFGVPFYMGKFGGNIKRQTRRVLKAPKLENMLFWGGDMS